MTTMTRADVASHAPTALHPFTRTASAVAVWILASIVVVMAHRTFDPISAAAGVTVKTLTIVVAGFAYARLAYRRTTFDQALAIGVAWLVLGIMTEIVMTAQTHHAWFLLLGSPAKPFLRDVIMFAWVAAPAIFARYES
jgi:hypothetical protein